MIYSAMKEDPLKQHSPYQPNNKLTSELDFEFNFCKSLYEKLPNDKRVIALLAELYTQNGFYDAGLELDRKLVAMDSNDSIARCNLACSLVLMSELNEALECLKEAIRSGFKELKWILEDPDLANLRETEAFFAYKHELGIQ